MSNSQPRCSSSTSKKEFNVTVTQDVNGDFSVERVQMVRDGSRRVFSRVNKRNLTRALKCAAKQNKLQPV